MRDPLLNEEPKPANPFVSIVHGEKTGSAQIDSAVFLKSTFEQDPGKGLELLFRRFYNPLCSHAVRFVYSKQIAEDLVSEVFFQFYRTRAYENINSSYTSYLFRSVRNECYTYMRREFGKTDSLESNTENTISTSHQQPDAEIHYNNLFLKINEVIGKLPAQCQRVFLMSRFEGKRNSMIAEELGISVKTVEGHITKGLSILRKALQDHGLLSIIQIMLLFI